MIITKTPFRMSFFGGGTDMESFFKEFGGAVLSTTFDKYCYVNVRHLPRFFDYSTELSYSKTERVTDVDQIQHPAIRNAMKMLDMYEIRLTYEADLPARSGLGTSSSFAVGMLNAFYALKGKYADKKKLADEAIYLERVLCNEAGGWQDQIAASFGGMNRIDFNLWSCLRIFNNALQDLDVLCQISLHFVDRCFYDCVLPLTDHPLKFRIIPDLVNCILCKSGFSHNVNHAKVIQKCSDHSLIVTIILCHKITAFPEPQAIP